MTKHTSFTHEQLIKRSEKLQDLGKQYRHLIKLYFDRARELEAQRTQFASALKLIMMSISKSEKS